MTMLQLGDALSPYLDNPSSQLNMTLNNRNNNIIINNRNNSIIIIYNNNIQISIPP